jgi:hypothetical protein
MTIDEAIRIIQENAAWLDIESSKGLFQALQLGIEALKRIKRQRLDLAPAERKPLPGETEEEEVTGDTSPHSA